MTDIITPAPQNTKVDNREVKKNNSNSETSENSFLSIIQAQIDEVNKNPKADVSQTNTKEEATTNNKSLNKTDLLNTTTRDNLALLAKNKLKSELKMQEGVGNLKNSKNIEDLIKVANEKGLNVEKLKVSKLTTQELNEKQKLLNFNNLKKVEEQKTILENKNLLILEGLKGEKAQESKDALLNSLLRGTIKSEPQKDVFANGFSLESLLQKDENMIGKKVKRDKFAIANLKLDKNSEQVEVKKEISLDLKLDGNTKTSEVEIRNKMVDAKTTINTFASNLKEKMQEYKPPLMKMELTLNPKELGNVDITLITRGNSVQINLASNSQAMQLFAQNATEFKNALANIGFDNVEMNFNSNQGGEQGSQNSQDGQSQRVFKYYADNDTNFSLEELNSLSSIDLVIPNYA